MPVMSLSAAAMANTSGMPARVPNDMLSAMYPPSIGPRVFGIADIMLYVAVCTALFSLSV